MKQILMVGAGSVGGFFGAQLAKANLSVSFLLRPRTLVAVKQNGLTIRSADGSFTVHPPADSDPRDLPKPDLIILSIKAYDLDEVLTQIEPVLTEKTVILTLQNGVDTEDRKNRLKEQIADPLNKTCAEQFPRLDERLTGLDFESRFFTSPLKLSIQNATAILPPSAARWPAQPALSGWRLQASRRYCSDAASRFLR